MQAFSPAQTQKAPDVIYDQIYQRIVSGKLKSGDRLPSERVLAEQFQRSRHIIREALRMLQQDGLITIEVGSAGGAIIQGISIDMLSAPLKKYLSSGDLDLRELTEYRPQELVSMIVGKAVNMAKKMDIPIIGLIENMSYLECPDCGKRISVFGESHIEDVAKEYGIPVLAQIPIDPKIAEAVDQGTAEYRGLWRFPHRRG